MNGKNEKGIKPHGKDAYEGIKKVHKKISEEMWLLKDVLQHFSEEHMLENIRKSVDFVKNTLLKHFEWEERDVFPVALAIGDIEIKQVVRELQQQHIIAISKFDIMADLIIKYGFSFPNEEVKSKFSDAAKELLAVTLDNARREDDILFPFLMQKNIPLNLQEQFA